MASRSSEYQLLLKSVRERCRKRFSNLDDPLNLFRQLTSAKHPLPSVFDLNTIVGAIVRMKHYSTAISLSHDFPSLGIRFNDCSFNILINCYCHLNYIDFAFSVLGKMMKLGFEPNNITFTTLINGHIVNDRPQRAALLFQKISSQGFRPNLFTYGALVKVIYNNIVDSLCKDKLLTEALDLFFEMKSKCIAPDEVTYRSLIRGFRSVDESVKEVIKREQMDSDQSFEKVMKQIRRGLEVNDYGMQQWRRAHMRFLGELYNYEHVDSFVIFETLSDPCFWSWYCRVRNLVSNLRKTNLMILILVVRFDNQNGSGKSEQIGVYWSSIVRVLNFT